MALLHIHGPFPGTGEYVKGTYVKKAKDHEWGDYPELSGWALHDPKDAYDAGLDSGGRGHEARKWAALRSLKGKGMGSPLEPLEGTQPCRLTD